MRRIAHVSRPRSILVLCKQSFTTTAPAQSKTTELNTSPSINGTLKAYSRHILVPTGTKEWPPRPESFYKNVRVLQSCLMRELKGVKLTVTDVAAEGGNDARTQNARENTHMNSDDTMDMIIFPESIRISKFPVSELQRLPSLLANEKAVESIKTQFPNTQVSEWKGTTLVVCTHGSRDCRCGTVGETVFQMLETKLRSRISTVEDLTNTTSTDASSIRLLRTSHVGGHEYAANVIVYPKGYFFGNIRTAQDVEELCDFIDTSKVSEKLKCKLRGTMGDKI